MSDATRFRRRPGNHVTAIQVSLEFDGFTCLKWGHDQRCEPGDWLVNDSDDVYTVKREVFARTYAPVDGQKGRYEKLGKVWAKPA